MRYFFAIGLWGLLSLTGVQAQEANPVAPRGRTAEGTKLKLAPNIKAEALWDGRKLAPFKALDGPPMVRAAEADFLEDGDYILGVTIGAESRAYPTRYIWWHHVVNDRITNPKTGKESWFAVTYCSVCNTGVRYNLALDGKTPRLDFFGLYNGVVTLCDRETGSVFLQASGEFVAEPLLGKSLKMAPLLDTTWGEWKKLHPTTLVMSPDTPYRRFYNPKDRPEPRGYEAFPAPFFRPSMAYGDLRLPPFDKVVGAILPPAGEPEAVKPLYRAYPIKALKEAGGVLNDTLGTAAVVALLELNTATANIFSRTLDGKTLTFEARKDRADKVMFYDKETGTRWNLEGRGESGPMAGKTLERIENHLSQWYGWSAYFPDTSIFGRTDPPKPGDPFAKPGEEKTDGAAAKEPTK